MKYKAVRAALKPEFCDIAAMAATMGVNHMTMRRALARGEVKHYWIGRKVLIRTDDFRAWLENLKVSKPTQLS